MLWGIAHSYMQRLTSKSKPKGSKCKKKALTLGLNLNILLITLLDLVLGQKEFPKGILRLGKPIQILAKSSFLAFATKKLSYDPILYF